MSSRGWQRTIENKNPNLELKIVSASNISNNYATDKIDAYAVVSINGDDRQKKQAAKTPIDYDGGSNPTWNHTVKFSVDEERVLSTIYVKLYSFWLEGEDDIFLGEVNVSVKELIDSEPFTNGNVNKMKSMTYPIKFKGEETKPNAKLSLSYRFKPVPVNDLYPPHHDQPTAPVYSHQPVYPNPGPAVSGQHIMYTPQFQTTGQTTTAMKLTMELVIKSAREIKNVNVFDDMDVYASVMICEDKTTVLRKAKTPIAYSGFKFPSWNHAVKFSFDQEELAREDRLSLVVELMSHRLLGDKHIGKVNVRIQELMASNRSSPNVNSMKLVTHNVRGLYGEQGTLSFTYRFLEEQVTAPNPTPQPIIMYIPVPHPSYGSSNPVHGTTGYMAVQSGANVGPSNGMVPIYMPPPLHQPHSLPSLQPQPKPQPPPHKPTQSEVNTQGARPQVKPQGGSMGRLGVGAAAFGRVVGGALMNDIGGALMGDIGGAVMSEMMSDEVNIYEVGA